MSDIRANNITKRPTRSHTTLWIPKATQQLHTPGFGVNPLIDHAAGFFQLLHEFLQYPDEKSTLIFEQTKQNLTEIHDQYHKLPYPKNIVLAAHFALCATIDDSYFIHIPYTENRPSLLKIFHQQENYEQKFVNLLDYTLNDPEKYIDLIELMYLCLLFGFKGNFRQSDFSLTRYQQLREQVYVTILKIRGGYSSVLSPQLHFNSLQLDNYSITDQGQITSKQTENLIEANTINWLSYLKTSIATVFIIMMLGTIFHFIYQDVTVITPIDKLK